MTISRPAARRGLLIYLATVAALSAPIEFGIIATDALAELGTSILWLTGLMLVPTVGSGSVTGTVFPAVSSVGFCCRPAVGECGGERVQRWFPPHGPSCLAFPGRVQGPGDQVEALDRGLLGREVPAGLDRAPVAGVQGLDRVSGTDDLRISTS